VIPFFHVRFEQRQPVSSEVSLLHQKLDKPVWLSAEDSFETHGRIPRMFESGDWWTNPARWKSQQMEKGYYSAGIPRIDLREIHFYTILYL
jgi:hypothetical protein